MKVFRLASFYLLALICLGPALKAQPFISTVSSAHATIGSIVTISGSGFNSNVNQNIVLFGTVRADIVSASPTELKVVVPRSGNDAYISVINTGTGRRGTSKHQFSNRYCVGNNPGFNTMFDFHWTSSNTGMFNPNAVDADGDGRTDLVTGNSQHSHFRVQLGQSGNLPALSNGQIIPALPAVNAPHTVVTGDMNNDGLDEVILSTTLIMDAVRIYHNQSSPGNILFNLQLTIPLPGPPGPMAVNDFDSDGVLDIAVASTNGNIYVMRGLGNIAFSAPVAIAYSGAINDLFSTDMDDDRRPDLLPAGSSGVMLLNTSVPGTISFTTYSMGSLAAAQEFDAVDMDQNGVVDLLVRTGGILYVHRNIGTPGSPLFATPVVVHHGVSIGAGDLTGDGKADPFYTMAGGWICANENISTPGNCQWGGQRDFQCSSQGSRFFRGDFNGDGIEDFGSMGTDGRVNIVSATAGGIYGIDLTVGSACGTNVGSASVSQLFSSTSTAGAVYAWSNGASGPSVSGLGPGTYVVTVTSGSCSFSADFIVVGGNAITAQVNVTQPVCLDDDGVATVVPSGGNYYLYNWSTGASTAQTTLQPGSYTVTVTAETGCQTSQSLVINPGENVQAQLAVTQPTCLGQMGTASVTSVSGGSNHTYNWTGGQQTASANFAAGAYSVTVTSAAGCEDIETFNVLPGNGLPLNAGPDQTVCEGEDVILQGAGTASSFLWSNGVTDGVAFQATSTAYYVLSGVNAACAGNDTVWVNVNQAPETQFIYTPNQLSVQFNDQTPGFVSRQWTFGDNNTSTSGNPVHTYAAAGTYEVCLTTINGAGCSRTVCETITLTTTDISAPVGFHFSVAPNPVSDVLHVSIEHPAGGILNLRVMDATGKVLASTPFSGKAAELNVAALAPGVYILEVADGEVAARTRFVKQD